MSLCPHCGVTVESTAAFCPSCGKAVSTGTTGPRIVEREDLASTRAGLELQAEGLLQESRKAFVCLLIVGILQFVAAGILLAIELPGLERISAVLGIIGLVFLGLAFWARRSPLPAAITGLVILLTLWALDAVVDPASAAQGIVLKLIIVVVLGRAIQAGLRHRKLLREMRTEPA
jgi:hypothetical protein